VEIPVYYYCCVTDLSVEIPVYYCCCERFIIFSGKLVYYCLFIYEQLVIETALPRALFDSSGESYSFTMQARDSFNNAVPSTQQGPLV
jgi:hypothetical protein